MGIKPNKDELMGGWRKLLNEKLHNLYSSLSIISIVKSRRMRRMAMCTNGGKRNAYRLLVESQTGKRPRPRQDKKPKIVCFLSSV
jgi:hypothetical protein